MVVRAALVALLVLAVGAVPARADHTPVPGTVALVGTLQSELACPGDWQPECPQTRLQPVPGSPGVFRATFEVPAGTYEYKVALNNSWDENYGAGGAPGGANIALSAPGGPITFTYDHATHVISDDLPRPVGAERGAHWLRAGVIAWDLPDDRDGLSYRLHWAPDGGLAAEDGAIVGGSSFPLELDAAGLPAGVRKQYPHLGAYEALRVSGAARRRARELLTGQLVVAAYDADGRLVRATGMQIPGVLDDLYATDARLGPTWRGRRPQLAVWAPTAKQVGLLISLNGLERRVAMRRGEDGVWRAQGRRGWRNAAYAYEVEVYVPTLDEVVTNVVTDPYSLALTTNSRRSVLVDLRAPRSPRGAGTGSPSRRSPSPRTRPSTSSTSATSRSPTRRSRRRTAAPTSPSRTRAATACATCAGSRAPG